MMKLAPNVITQTQEFWSSLGIEIDVEQAEEIARAYLELIDLIQQDGEEVDHDAA